MENAAPAVDPVAAPQGQPAAPAAETPQPGTQNAAPTTPTGEAANNPAPASNDAGTPPEPKQNWADNWRQLMAEGVGGDEKILKRLERFTTPAEVLKWALNAEKKISSGEYKKALGKDASPEEVATWRKENGIPEKPTEYLADLHGIVIGEDDQPGVNSMLEFAAQNNIPKPYVQGMVKWYDSWKEAQEQQIQEEDSKFQREAEDKLRQEWGGEYRMNLNAVKSFAINAFGEDLANDIFNARLPDGSLFGNNPQLNMAFASLARELNPAATLVPAGTSNSLQTINDEIATLEKFMRTNRDEWFKDSAKQSRYQQLISAREKMK